MRRPREQRVFPDINFTCNGSLTKWIVVGTVGDMVGGEVQIWRRNAGSENNYTKVGFSVLLATDPDNDNVYEYTPNPPLEFQEGDILGVYQRGGPNRTAIYYHTTTGPTNYRNNVTFNTPLPAPATLNGAVLVAQYDYPLVTVEICESNHTLLLITICTMYIAINAEATPSLSVSGIKSFLKHLPQVLMRFSYSYPYKLICWCWCCCWRCYHSSVDTGSVCHSCDNHSDCGSC